MWRVLYIDGSHPEAFLAFFALSSRGAGSVVVLVLIALLESLRLCPPLVAISYWLDLGGC